MDSAIWAAEAGIPYCIADFINSDGLAMADIYRKQFKPSRWCATPYLMIASWAIAATEQDEAKRLALPAQMMFAYLLDGTLIPVPSVEKAVRWAAQNRISTRRRRTVLGSPSEVKEQLDDIILQFGAQEMMLVNIMSDHDLRKRSYELVAKEFGLAKRARAD